MGIEATVDFSILDDSLGIDWRIPTEHANLSEKDTKHPLLKEFESPFTFWLYLFKDNVYIMEHNYKVKDAT